ncbi:MAG: hypothetical protein QNJ58_15900 [Desulfobacterales bacterium]|nr:hypothetical protein [Desulfobacterales bacterium]
MPKNKNHPKRCPWVIPLVVLIAIVCGCASHKAVEPEPAPARTKTITEIAASENSEAVVVTIIRITAAK